MKVLLREFPKMGANGDRDTGPGVPYSDYHVVLVNDEGDESVVTRINGYDNFWTAPHDRTATKKEAEGEANKQARFFKTKVKHVMMKPKYQKQEWVEA